MRRSLLTLALLALATACAQGQSTWPLVVLVHGRGHLEDDTASLRREWKRDLDTGLNRAGLEPLRDEDVRLAWYADVLDPARAAGCPAPLAVPDSLGLGQLARDFISSLAGALPASGESRDLRVILGDMLYVVDDARRCGAQERVRAALDSAARERRPVVVVAYSLGTVVSHAVLARMPNDGMTPVRLITIGSPLGNPELRAILGDESALAVPGIVSGWENVFDPNDAFAAPLGARVPGVRDVELTPDSTADPHHVSRYLRDPALGAALGRALCALGALDARACAGAEAFAKTRPSP